MTLALPSDTKDNEILTCRFKLNIIKKYGKWVYRKHHRVSLDALCELKSCFLMGSSTHPLFHTVFTCYSARHCSLCCTTALLKPHKIFTLNMNESEGTSACRLSSTSSRLLSRPLPSVRIVHQIRAPLKWACDSWQRQRYPQRKMFHFTSS